MRHSWDFVILCDTSFFPWDFMILRHVFCVYKAASILSVFPIPFPPVPCGYPGRSPYCDFHHVTSSLLWLCHHSCFSFSPLLIPGAGTNTIIICLILASLPLASRQLWDQRGLSCWVRRWLILRPEGMFNILFLWAILKTTSYASVRLSYWTRGFAAGIPPTQLGGTGSARVWEYLPWPIPLCTLPKTRTGFLTCDNP